MDWYVTSDVHLGNRHCRVDAFRQFVRDLPDGAGLVLNGDTIDRWHVDLTGAADACYDLLCRESQRRRVIWVAGNHDDTFVPDDRANIEFCTHFVIADRFYISHGHDFDNVMPYNRLFLNTFRLMHRTRIRLGAPAVHVAEHAKKFPLLYRVLRRNVMMNAVRHARENGFEAAICGHTHFPEDVMCEDVRYLNTGAWTEPPQVLVVTSDALKLTPVTVR